MKKDLYLENITNTSPSFLVFLRRKSRWKLIKSKKTKIKGDAYGAAKRN